MALPGSGRPVTGSINWAAVDEKLPARMASVGTVAYWSNSSSPRLPP